MCTDKFTTELNKSAREKRHIVCVYVYVCVSVCAEGLFMCVYRRVFMCM